MEKNKATVTHSRTFCGNCGREHPTQKGTQHNVTKETCQKKKSDENISAIIAGQKSRVYNFLLTRKRRKRNAHTYGGRVMSMLPHRRDTSLLVFVEKLIKCSQRNKKILQNMHTQTLETDGRCSGGRGNSPFPGSAVPSPSPVPPPSPIALPLEAINQSIASTYISFSAFLGLHH